MQILTKYPADAKDFDFDFTGQSEIVDGGVISIVAIVKELIQGTDNLTVGAPTASGGRVQFRLSGGTLGDVYRLKCVCTLNTGFVLSGYGRLAIIEDIP